MEDIIPVLNAMFWIGVGVALTKLSVLLDRYIKDKEPPELLYSYERDRTVFDEDKK